MQEGREPSSFRDPSGFVFRHGGELLRQVNPVYRDSYELLESSGLRERLTSEGLLLPHEEVEHPPPTGIAAYRVIRPRPLAFVSYPYEWAYSQLRDAALLTLRIQRFAIGHGMSLRDASAFNVQLDSGRAVFIDTLSFERLDEGRPWVAYRQFCRHFLAPLALMARRDLRLGQLLWSHLDGLPLQLAADLLPVRTRWNPGLALHLHWHARGERRWADAAVDADRLRGRFSRARHEALVDSLLAAVSGLGVPSLGSEWSDYYRDCAHYGDAGQAAKVSAVAELLAAIRPRTVWDLGANTGRFSRVAVEAGARTVVAWDLDPACVELNYREVTRNREAAVHPLLLDLANPSPGLGWANRERASFVERGPCDAVLCLGLLHHLVIGAGVPLDEVAGLLRRLCRHLVVEWVPKEDPQVQRMLAPRSDIFPEYVAEGFEAAFARHFRVERSVSPASGPRRLYWMSARSADA